MSYKFFIFYLFIIFSSSLFSIGDGSSPYWPQDSFNAQHSMVSPHSYFESLEAKVIDFPYLEGSDCKIVVDSEENAIICCKTQCYQYNPNTKKFGDAPFIATDMAVSSDGYFYLINTEMETFSKRTLNEDITWTIKGKFNSGVLLSTSQDKVFVTMFFQVYCFSIDGELIWLHTTDTRFAGLVLSYHQEILYLKTNSRLTALNVNNGSIIWTATLPFEIGDIISSPSSQSEVVFLVGSYSNQVALLSQGNLMFTLSNINSRAGLVVFPESFYLQTGDIIQEYDLLTFQVINSIPVENCCTLLLGAYDTLFLVGSSSTTAHRRSTGSNLWTIKYKSESLVHAVVGGNETLYLSFTLPISSSYRGHVLYINARPTGFNFWWLALIIPVLFVPFIIIAFIYIKKRKHQYEQIN